MINREQLLSFLHYNPDTGDFTWLVSTAQRVKVGDIAGGYTHGYKRIVLCGQNYAAHRLAFLYMTGSFPPEQVDHINGVRDDNRWSNLRAVSQGTNLKNQAMKSNNTVGVSGVWRKKQSWRVDVMGDGKRYRISFSDRKFGGKDISLAHASDFSGLLYAELGFHPNHGRESIIRYKS